MSTNEKILRLVDYTRRIYGKNYYRQRCKELGGVVILHPQTLKESVIIEHK